jgi:hypothetical protein
MNCTRCITVLLFLGLGFSSPASAATPEAVKASADRGVAALKLLRDKPSGVKKHPIGAVALWGLTLLECDVPPSDPTIRQAAAQLREACIDLTHNYSLSLAVMFFDRLGDPGDVYLLQSLGVRLLLGQHHADGWSYQSPRPAADEVRRLTQWVKLRNEEAAKATLPAKPAPNTGKLPRLPVELEQLLKQWQRPAETAQGVGDNSNTQFAVMALWTARRHGVPVEEAMTRVSQRFRSTQAGDGGWGYVPVKGGQGAEASTASMTCAGLLALAMSRGVAVETAQREPRAAGKVPPDPAQDPVIRSGLVALGGAIASAGSGTPGKGVVLNKGYYLLWSLERVGVAYNLTTLGSIDWFGWGSDILLACQGRDGSWRGEEGPEVDTCFALLFLRRANLSRDLSATLKGIKDPGQVTLKAGGIGGAELLARKITLGLSFGNADPQFSLPTHLDPEAARLCRDLLQAPAPKQPELIDRLKENKGVIYSDALAAAIPHLPDSIQDRARDALAERFTRMTAATLCAKLADEDVEVRVAAVRACATKDDRNHVSDLIALLTDPQPRVARVAHAALKLMTRQDFGPPADATAAQRDKAVAAWKAWWQKQAPK